MAADFLDVWSPAAIVAAQTALLGLLDAQTGAANVTLHDASDTLLCTVPLTDPAGTVDPATGALTLTPASTALPVANGTASYATLRDGAGTALCSMACEEGDVAVAGRCVLTSLGVSTVLAVTLISFGIS